MMTTLFGALLAVSISSFVAVSAGLLIVIACEQWLGDKARDRVVRALQWGASIPSIVFLFLACAMFGTRADALPEHPIVLTIALTCMIFPQFLAHASRSARDMPVSSREAALGLGATRASWARHVLLPALSGSLRDGAVVAISRAVIEATVIWLAISALLRGAP